MLMPKMWKHRLKSSRSACGCASSAGRKTGEALAVEPERERREYGNGDVEAGIELEAP
jgi:hypothetical protein